GTLIQGNYIGTDRSGTLARGNSDYGVVVGNAPGTIVGGTDPGAGNVIAGSTVAGVAFFSTRANGVLQGNFIGTNSTGTAALPDALGVIVYGGSTGILIGGTTTTA